MTIKLQDHKTRIKEISTIRKYLKFCLIFIAASITVLTDSNATLAEETYLKTRNNFTRQFEDKNNFTEEKDKAALGKLENLLQEIIGPVKFSNQKGKINLRTLKKDEEGYIPDYGYLDGLEFYSGKEAYVVTTKTIFDDYLVNSKYQTKDFESLSQNSILSEFLNDVFSRDAVFNKYSEIPVTDKKFKNAHAFLFLESSDILILPPNHLIILAEKDDKIFVISSDISDDHYQISACLDKNNNPSQELSQPYLDCFEKNLKHEKFFSALTLRIQSILDSI